MDSLHLVDEQEESVGEGRKKGKGRRFDGRGGEKRRGKHGESYKVLRV